MLFLLFFFSGAASLVYEVVWVRTLGLVFGASHLAVTTVLAVYMGGQALGSWALGGPADRAERPLRLYGLLELGIGASALGFLALTRAYPALYGPLARVAEDNGAYLTALRASFAVLALIVPTSLMGGTLPALSRFVVARAGGPARQVSFLYASNTLGAVAGALVTGFYLLEALGVTATTLLASGISAVVGVAAILLQRRVAPSARGTQPPAPPRPPGAHGDLRVRVALVGIGASGFCALGYEVLWTRMLTLVVGTSVYSFTIMLGAFLAGLALGSHAYGVLSRRGWAHGGRRATLLFAATQIATGLSALAVTVRMRDLPRTADHLQAVLAALHYSEFGGRLASSFTVGFAYLLAPAFFMGMAFPASAAICSPADERVGSAVGRVLGANTVGAILGSAVSGYVLIFLFGIERSLQLLVIVNLATGAAVASSLRGTRRLLVAVTACAALLLVARGASPAWGRVWDRKFFAIYNNAGRSFDTAEHVQQALEDTDVLYYREGVNETVSVIRPHGDTLETFVVNGRPEASTAPVDMQVQRTLGHLPVLLHPRPRSVFVLGTGTGMTLGAVLAHPEVERVTLGEIEEGALGVARHFASWNGRALDSPKLRIVFNDGRNYLASTRAQFDVVTADPIHPWSGGAAYLYTEEYFRIVSSRLAPGGIAAQWLPLYELSTKDVRTVMRTFTQVFPHVMVWLTYYDAVLVGSNAPLRVDEADIARRLDRPEIRAALAPIRMASARDFLSYFAMADSGARAFAAGGDVNTDDNLSLEFSAPRSQGLTTEGSNVAALAEHRESIVPYLVLQGAPEAQRETLAFWTRRDGTGRQFDPVHARFLDGEHASPWLEAALSELRSRDPAYGPLLFLLDEKLFADRIEPALVAEAEFAVPGAARERLRISAVEQFVGRGRVLISFVDNARRVVYGQRWVFGDYDGLERASRTFIAETLDRLRDAMRVRPAAATSAELADDLRQQLARLVGPPLSPASPRTP